MQPIVTLTLSLEDAKAVYQALLERTLVEDALRREQGLEAVDAPVLVERLEQVLGIGTKAANEEVQAAEDTLWQHAWLLFTDEWAWHRAKQEIEKEAKKLKGHSLTVEELDAAAEKRYEERFDRYVEEIRLPGHENGGFCAETNDTRPVKQQKPRHS